MDQERLEALLREYRDFRKMLTPREKARLESELMRLAKYLNVVPKGVLPGAWLSKQLEEKEIAINRRRTLFNLGDLSSPLWERMEKGMPLCTAVRLSLKARRDAKAQKRPPAECLNEVLQEYENPKHTYVTASGGRRHGLRRKRNDSPASIRPGATKDFWSRLYTLASDFIKERLDTVTNGERRMLATEFEFQMRAVYEDLVAGVRRISKQEQDTPIGKTRLQRACAVLDLDPPTALKPLDPELEKKRYRKLIAQYHPDRNPGEKDERMLRQYRAILDAHQILTQYFKEQKGKK